MGAFGRKRPFGVSFAALVVALAASACTTPNSGSPRSTAGSPSARTSGTATCAPDGVPGKYTRAQLEYDLTAINGLVDTIPGGSQAAYMSGVGPNAVNYRLQPGEERIAAAIESAFGDAVTIMVGASQYCHGSGVSPACGTLPTAVSPPAGMRVSADVVRPGIQEGGASFDGQLTMKNVGSTPASISITDPVAALVRSGTRTVIGFSVIDSTLDLYVRTASPGQAIPMRFGLDPALCGGSRGSEPPPGRCDLLAWMPAGTSDTAYFAPPVPVMLTAPTR